ncbi:MAG: hypothetical protein ACREME_09820, partial [Gemmatimonadales bacterium]
GHSTSLLDLLALIRKVTGHRLQHAVYAPRAGDVRDSLANLHRAERVLGYRSRISLEEGLRRTWKAFAQRDAGLASAPALRLSRLQA